MPYGHRTGARLVALVAVTVVGGLGVLVVTGCGGSESKDQARHADPARTRLARERRERLHAEKLRERRARRARARRAREQQAASCGPALVRQGGYCVVPQPSGGGQTTGQTTTPSDQAPSVDSPKGQQKLKQDPDCQGEPPPPASYHGPVQC